MNIGLIDIDGHNFPNLALMKLSAYHTEILKTTYNLQENKKDFLGG